MFMANTNDEDLARMTKSMGRTIVELRVDAMGVRARLRAAGYRREIIEGG